MHLLYSCWSIYSISKDLGWVRISFGRAAVEKQTVRNTEGEHMTRIRQGKDNGPLTQGHPQGECLLSKFTTAAGQTQQAKEPK